MRVAATIAILLVLLGGCSSAPPRDVNEESQPVEPERPPNPTTVEDLAPYRLSPDEKEYPLYVGDEITVQVQGHPELSIMKQVPVDGKIPVYGVAEEAENGEKRTIFVQAAGRRIPELEAEFRKHYSRILSSPYVTVRVVAYAPKTIFITGAVTSPSDYALPDEKRISLVQALTMAGWFTPVADKENVRIIRVDPETGERFFLPPIDVERIVSERVTEMDLYLCPGDTITVASKALEFVYIYGAVQKAGTYEYSSNLTLTKLITLAGGLGKFAKTSDIRILRHPSGPQPTVFRVDLDRVFKQQDPDFRLAPGDVVNIYERFI